VSRRQAALREIVEGRTGEQETGGAAPFDFAPFDKLRIYDRTSEIVEGDATRDR
jgi:hypothetical protein